MNIYQVPHLVIHPVSFTMLMVTAYLSTHTVYQYKINKNLIIGGGGGGGGYGHRTIDTGKYNFHEILLLV